MNLGNHPIRAALVAVPTAWYRIADGATWEWSASFDD